MLVKEKNDLQKSFSFNFYIENDYRKGSCPVTGGNALRQEKVWQKKNPSIQAGAEYRTRRGIAAGT